MKKYEREENGRTELTAWILEKLKNANDRDFNIIYNFIKRLLI